MIEIGWYVTLAVYRTAEEIPGVIERLQACEITAEVLDKVLSEPDSLLYAPERDGEGWAKDYGGSIGVSLLTAELLAYLANQRRLATRIHRDLVTESVATNPISTVARSLGITEAAVSRLLTGPTKSPAPSDDPTEGTTP